LKDCAEIVGTDLKTYGPYKAGDVAALPGENASILIKLGIAEPRYAPATKPTLKEMLKGTVLTPFIEAAKVKPLGETPKLKPEETGQIADYFLMNLRDAGVELPTRFKGEFEKALDINKSWQENLEIMDKLIAEIVAREKPKTEEEELIEKARERADKLLGEIRELRGVKAAAKEVKVYSPIMLKPEDNFDEVYNKLISEGWGVNTAEYMQADTVEEAVKLQAASFPSLEFQPVLLPNPTVMHPFINAGKWIAFHRGRLE